MKKPPFAWRVFLLAFVPVCGVLVGSFTAVRVMLSSQVIEGLRASQQQANETLMRVQAAQRAQNRRILSVLVEKPELRAAFRKMSLAPKGDPGARLQLQSYLLHMSQSLGLDIGLAADESGVWIAGVRRASMDWTAIAGIEGRRAASGLLEAAGAVYKVTVEPVKQDGVTLGMLAVGKAFGFEEFATPAVLLRNGRVVASSLSPVSPAALENAMAACSWEVQCDLMLGGKHYLSLPMDSAASSEGYVLRSLQSVHAASVPMEKAMSQVLRLAGFLVVLLLVPVSLLASKSVVRPLTDLARRLTENWRAGELQPLELRATTREVEELANAFNQAARALSDVQGRLSVAYMEFLQSMVSAIDARDIYTAGHSARVSSYASAIGEALGMEGHRLEMLRVGALLHDVGKIGVPDSILQKPAELTPEEFDVLKRHPEIGRRIVERVEGFHAYLPIVELHHESYDGNGYPYGLRGEETPLEVRIVRVADAYDAMTSDRPYRRGMRHEAAVAILRQCAGSQFDPELVEVFAGLKPESVRKDLITLSSALHCAEAPTLKGLAQDWDR